MPSNLTLADGQITSSLAELFRADSTTEQKVSVVFSNVGPKSETLLVTFQRHNGTPRRLARIVLGANEQFYIVGLPVQSREAVLAQLDAKADTPKAASKPETKPPVKDVDPVKPSGIDYIVYGRSDGPLQIYSLDAHGALKGSVVGPLERITPKSEGPDAKAVDKFVVKLPPTNLLSASEVAELLDIHPSQVQPVKIEAQKPQEAAIHEAKETI